METEAKVDTDMDANESITLYTTAGVLQRFSTSEHEKFLVIISAMDG